MVARDGLAGVARVLARLGSVVRELLREASQVSEIQKETQAARRLPYPATREDRRRASLLPEGRMDTLASLATRNRADLKSGVDVTEIKEHSVLLGDGTELPADLIVYATGYGSMNGWAAKLISQEVADKVGKCWGLGSDTKKDPGPWEGELRNMWKPTRQEALWFHGGNLHQSRHYSLYLALQLKARMEGIPTPVYGLQDVHHLR